MKYSKLLIVTIFTIASNFCQSQDLKWASNFGGNSINSVCSLTTQKTNNEDYIVAGILEGTLDFDFSTISSYPLTALSKSVFIARYSSTGNFKWAILLDATNGFHGTSYPKINVGGDDNIILSLISDDKIDFDPSTFDTYYLSSTYNDTEAAYLAKYDGDGNFTWAKKFDTENGLIPACIETDNDGNIYLTGFSQYNQDFDFTSAVYTLNGTANAFLAKYTPSGALVFAKGLISGSVGITAMKMVNNAELVFVGDMSSSANFNTGGTAVYLSGGSNGSYIAKYKIDGSFVCANTMYIGSYLGGVNDVTVDIDGNMYAVGDFTESIDFNGPTNTGQVISGKDPYMFNGFIVKYNSLAEVVWYFSLGSTNYDESCRAVAIDSKNNLIVAGLFKGEVDFDPTLASYQSLQTASHDIFLATYTLDKAYVSAKQLTFSTGIMEMEMGMEINDSDEIVLRGLAYSPTDVDPSSNIVLVHPVVASDIDFYISVYNTSSSITTSVRTSDSRSFSAYPNPVLYDMLYITDLDNSLLDTVPIVTSIDGKNIPFTYTKNQDGITIQFNELSKGVYFITIGENTVKVIR
jgi:hypothetical protein